MALLFIDSFDHYNSSQMNRKWTIGGSAIVPGRTGNGANVGTFENPSKTLQVGANPMAVGLAYNTPGFANNIIFMQNQLPTPFSTTLGHVGDGRVVVSAAGGGGGASSGPSVWVMHVNTWYYLELQATISVVADPVHNQSDWTCVYVVRVNGNQIMSGTLTWITSGQLTATLQYITVGPGGPGTGLEAIIDDFYVTDGELLGDIAIYPLFPRLDGTRVQWIPNPTGSHFSDVNEHAPDDFTTTVSCPSSATGSIDEYYMDLIPSFSGTIKGAQSNWCVIKSDVGDAAIRGVYDSGSLVFTVDPATSDGFFHPSDVSWEYYSDAQRFSVFTSGNWTVSEINGMQVGIERMI